MTRRVVQFDKFGGPEVLEVREVDTPVPGPGEVLVRVRAIGVNPLDAKIRAGMSELPLPMIPGIDLAGTVEQVGPGVESVAVGDAVVGQANTGSYAELAIAESFVPKPDDMSWELAAAVPVAAEVAVRVLGQLGLKSGETLLIHGAGGSAGSIATQLAVARGIAVVGTAGPHDQELVAELGASAVLYGDGWVDRVRAVAPEGVDAVFDTSGAGVLPESIDLVGGVERVITIADLAAFELGVQFSGSSPTDRAPGAIEEVLELVARGKVSLRVWKTYPLADAAEAHRDIASGATRGKQVLIP